MTKVICLGLAVWDQIFTLEHLPSGGGKNFAKSFTEVGGGPAATAAAAAARLGAETALWSRVGEDDVGRRILADLQSYGVDTANVRRFPNRNSGLAVVLIDAAGERMIVTPGDPGLDGDPAWLPLEQVAAADVVLADLRWPQGAKSLLAAARQSGTTSVLDADLTSEPEAIAPLVEAASHVVFSAPALRAFTGQEDARAGLAAARSKTQGIVAVTAGAEGCFWIDGEGNSGHQPAFPVTVVDTLGAGDVFHGAFALALGERQPLAEAMRFATAAAALKCTRPGGRAGTPSRAELEKFLQEN
ncbi:PfkB family carbohydrate kinase [Denitrobaculum tricleocarpae]|uniref:Ribokinase n=1 Tax=Denitrobaculum tricleocarpae TaxID=2591009 RepID=A0A545SZB8_9PROT|nr:PfkB family carbohydrate kinase [Denitrobaculum tricleocarpae]TQV70290.1 ribokinase [Denitrobaculum tricleocarpae]